MARLIARNKNFIGREDAKKRFLQWLERTDPFLYKAARRVHIMRGQRLHGMGAIDWSGFFTSAVDTVKTALPAYAQYKQQKDLMKLQMKRAEQGLPPIEAEAYIPPVKIEPVVNPETEAAIQRVATKTVEGGLTKMLLPMGLGLAALLMFMRRPRRR